jgi:hypothetical protein
MRVTINSSTMPASGTGNPSTLTPSATINNCQQAPLNAPMRLAHSALGQMLGSGCSTIVNFAVWSATPHAAPEEAPQGVDHRFQPLGQLTSLTGAGASR